MSSSPARRTSTAQPSRTLVVFDLDGTLTESCVVDETAFTPTVRAHLGAAGGDPAALDTRWETYEHVTDHGLLDEIWRRALGRAVSTEEIAAFGADFVARMAAELARTGERLRTVAGANELLASLRRAGYALALATGAMAASAKFKIESSGLGTGDMPVATSEDGPSRESVLLAARARAAPRDRVVYVGDAIWDVRTCQALDWPLIGRASGPKADVLRGAGVRDVFADWTDAATVCKAIERARPPGGA